MSQTPSTTAAFHPNVKDLTGQKFHCLTVLRRSHKDIHRNIHWLCRCECGNEKPVCGVALRLGKVKSCGCKTAEMISGSKITVDLTGKKFSRLTVVKRLGRRDARHREALWHCACECGGTASVSTSNLTSGNSTSCGCFQREDLSRRKIIHGLNKGGRSRIYNIFCGMIDRCENPKKEHYKDYGGRGIKVCLGWHDPVRFASDMGEPPVGMIIDRTNNDGNYSCGKCEQCVEMGWTMNCAWVTHHDSQRNRRSNRKYVFLGAEICLRDLSVLAVVGEHTIVHRVEYLGWTVEDAMFTPAQHKWKYEPISKSHKG